MKTLNLNTNYSSVFSYIYNRKSRVNGFEFTIDFLSLLFALKKELLCLNMN